MERPTGNVTFLFTDIEGSTKLAQDFSEALPFALERHNTILREAVGLNNGFMFKTIGDAFCCAFGNAHEAVRAATDAQIKLNSEKWKDAVIKVRMGIHTGKSEWNGSDYMGYVTLARTQRIMSAAYGGQILISENVYEMFSENSISVRDLGNRRLKDLIQPVNLYQILSTEIPADFPPLKTLDARPNNLPVQLTNFIGRETDISEIKKTLTNSRLITLLGPGGTGKTRLSMQIAADMIDEYSNGVFIAEIAQVSEPSLIIQTVMNSLGVNEVKGQSQDLTLSEFLKEKEMIIIMDNCEHLIKECAEIAEKLLLKCRKLKIIATSREALNCSGERTYKVPPLSLPDQNLKNSPEKLTQYEAVRLFIERALVINQEFRVTNENAPALANICYQLDGIPLAIELAAARINVLSLDGINERLRDRFKLLTGGKRTALPRQQTLRALIDWSYDLLSEKEKILWQRLTIFSGGWTFEASEKVCSDEILEEYEILDLLGNLIDKSLVKVTETDNVFRYTILETIKKYGNEKLTESGKRDELQEKYFNYFFELAKDSETGLTGNEQKEWINKMALENENIRECLNWSLKYNPESSLKMSVALGKFWELRSHFTEALESLRKRIDISESAELIWKAKAIYWTGFFYIHQGKYAESKKYLNQCLVIFNETNNKEGEALTMISLATIGLFETDYESLFSYSEKSLSLSKEINNRSYIARNKQNTALGLMQQGKYEDARSMFQESITVYRELNDHAQLAKIIGNIGALEYLLSNFDKARSAFEESLQIRLELGDRQGIAIALCNLGSVAYMVKDFDESQRWLEESLEITEEIGDKRISVTTLGTLGSIAVDSGDYSKAVKLHRRSIEIADEIGDKYSMAKGIEGFAMILVALKKYKAGCFMAAKYISLLKASNKNMIEGELIRIEEIKTTLKSNLNDDEFHKYWSEGETMTIEKVLEYAASMLDE
ncbi:MAG: tetratricopeptide repeat protein [Ignavibacteria bacterium]